MAVQPGLCQTWSETPKTGFLTTRLNKFKSQLITDRYKAVDLLSFPLLLVFVTVLTRGDFSGHFFRIFEIIIFLLCYCYM